MRKVVDDPRLIYKCCKMYYEDNLGQKEIADTIGISRVSVSRMLQAGRETGIVQIQIISPNHLTYSQLERELEQQFGIKEAVVVDNSPLSTSYDQISALSSATISLLESYLREGDVVGVSMGMTLHNICNGARMNTNSINCTFVPLLGGISTARKAAADVHSNQIALEFAQMFGGQYREFFSPAVFSDSKVLKGLMKETMMQEILKYYKEIKTAIMGIGTPNRATSTMVKAGYIYPEQVDEMVRNGMVGDLSLQFFDEEGNTSKFESFNERVAGMPLEQLKNVENKICIGGGEQKVKAIYGALKGGFVNILVTDRECAQQLIDMRKEKGEWVQQEI